MNLNLITLNNLPLSLLLIIFNHLDIRIKCYGHTIKLIEDRYI